MSDPTQDRTTAPVIKPEVFTTTVHDDDFREFKILITYHYFDLNGDRYMTEYNYRPVFPAGDVPDMRPECLGDDVRHAIQAREGGRINFTAARDMVLSDLT